MPSHALGRRLRSQRLQSCNNSVVAKQQEAFRSRPFAQQHKRPLGTQPSWTCSAYGLVGLCSEWVHNETLRGATAAPTASR